MAKYPTCYTVSLSSVVICFSLAFAFSSWARTTVSVGYGVICAYVTYWRGLYGIKAKPFRGAARLRELEKETKVELQQMALSRRLSEIRDVERQPEQEYGGRRGSGWTMTSRGVNGRRSRRATVVDSAVP